MRLSLNLSLVCASIALAATNAAKSLKLSKYKSSGLSGYGSVSWSSTDCWDSSYANIQGSKATTKTGGAANAAAVDSVYFDMSLVLDCSGGTMTRLNVYDWGWYSGEGLATTNTASVVIDSKLASGTFTKASQAYVYIETCTQVYDAEYDYYWSECTYDESGLKAVTVTATLTAAAGSSAYNSKQTYSSSSDYGRTRSTYSGSFRDATVTAFTATIADYGNVVAPAASQWYSYASLQKTTSSDMSFFKF